MKKAFYYLLAFAILCTSCNKEEIVAENESFESSESLAMRPNENDKPDEHTKIVLGQKLRNPYTVENMQNAFNYYNSVVGESPFDGKVVEATHYYIKITPSTIAHLEMLDELDNSDDENAPVLQDYPMDYEILVEGDYYIMPARADDNFHSAYM